MGPEIHVLVRVIVQALLVRQLVLEAVEEYLVSHLAPEAVQVIVKDLVQVVALGIVQGHVLMDVKHIALESVRLIVNMIKPILLIMEEIIRGVLFSLGQIQISMGKL